MSKKEEKEIAPEKFFEQRTEQILEATKKGVNVYPHKFEVKNTFEQIFEVAEKYENDNRSTEEMQAAGRISTIRDHSKFSFYTVVYNDESLQLVFSKDTEKKQETAVFLRRGDQIGFRGFPGKTRTGEKSLFCEEISVLSPCLRVIPSVKNLLTNAETIYRNRHIDLLVNKESKKRFLDRSKIIRFIRNYFSDLQFVEVETPMMNIKAGGAAARPFITHHNELKMDLHLRVAPELFLKKLVVGGMERVFEIGKNFRNEGIDLTHNPEFTAIEFYMAYADYKDLMIIVEDLLSKMCVDLKGSTKFTYAPVKRDTLEEIKVDLDFTAPFKRLDILDELNKELKDDLEGVVLTGLNITEKKVLEILKRIIKKREIQLSEPHTLNRILDAFIGEYIEPQCINPTFVTGFPTVMSPLAKDDRNREGITERFEMFVNGKELVNAYTELNIPDVQRERFRWQSEDAAAGDDEAMPDDEDFCQALEFGLPPTGGVV
ncbi:lysine--tRNA [Ecytonucleospora hepatopenaei]|uniref:Lysine--tRNA ligase n=1 Tax=Ecytonucleospora hepatopenaei TaxID=646526 RepID=A0A1W0E2W6_9MICR|nr:lysine--tRNA [Ecytonucleospora hepatopenaei]